MQKSRSNCFNVSFSWFENQQEAIDQANYYADYAEELGLSQNSVMVNDAETAPMINADATKVSVYFRDQLVKRGFKNVVHYSSASWFNNNWMEYDVLGKRKQLGSRMAGEPKC